MMHGQRNIKLRSFVLQLSFNISLVPPSLNSFIPEVTKFMHFLNNNCLSYIQILTVLISRFETGPPLYTYKQPTYT